MTWLSCVESVIIMMRIESNQPTKRSNARLMLSTAAGAALGAGARYIMPTKTEVGKIKAAGDTFFSNAATAARGANRSILKYAGIGALIAAGAHLLSRVITKNNEKYADSFEYSKYQAIIDAPDYATEIFLYGD